MFTASGTIGNSILTQTGTSSIAIGGGLTVSGTTTLNGDVTINGAADTTIGGFAYFNAETAFQATPVAGTSDAVVTIGNYIQNGNASGTYIGLNAPTSGAGSAADLINLQHGGASVFKVSSDGNSIQLQNTAGQTGFSYSNGAVTIGNTAGFDNTTINGSGITINSSLGVNIGAASGYGVSVTGTPTASATKSLFQVGSTAISGGNSATNGGTYIGLNAPSTGAGSAADLMNLQVGGTRKFQIEANGIVNSGDITMNDASGWATYSSTGIDYGDTGAPFTLSGANPVVIQGNISTPAFQVQASSGKTIFNIDPTTVGGTITFGDITSGNYITVASTGLTAFGTARHTKTILLPAEYAGAALDALSDSSCSSANSGSMASGFDTTSRQNFYSWTANTSGTQCYDVVVQVPVPSDFAAWSAAPTLYVANTSSSSTAVCAEAITTAGSVDANYGGYACTTTGSSLSSVTLPSLNGTYTAGGYLTFKIRLTSTGTTNVTKIGNLALQYYSKY